MTACCGRFAEGHELHVVLEDLWATAEVQQEAAAQEDGIEFWLWVLKQCFHQLLKARPCLLLSTVWLVCVVLHSCAAQIPPHCC